MRLCRDRRLDDPGPFDPARGDDLRFPTRRRTWSSQAGPRLAAKFEARQGDIAQAALHRPSDETALVALPGSAFQVRAMGTVAGDG